MFNTKEVTVSEPNDFMTTTDEMEKKLLEENEQLKEEIKQIELLIKPMEKQLQLNRKVLAVINKQKYKLMPKRKYAKKEIKAD